MTKEAKNRNLLSPMGMAINKALEDNSGRSLEEILEEINSQRVNKVPPGEVRLNKAKTVIVVDRDLRRFYTEEELRDLNK